MQILRKKALLAITFVYIYFPRAALAEGIKNPLGPKGPTTIGALLLSFVNFLLGLSAILALLALVAGGIRLIMAFGKEESVKSAKGIIFWAIAGLVVIISSYAIINIITSDILGG